MLRSVTPFVLFLVTLASQGQSSTPNLQLQLPNYQSPNWNLGVNQNFQAIDQAIGTVQLPYVGTWSSTTIYSRGQEVLYSAVLYASKINQNYNNTPATGSPVWMALPGGTASFPGVTSNGSNGLSVTGAVATAQLQAGSAITGHIAHIANLSTIAADWWFDVSSSATALSSLLPGVSSGGTGAIALSGCSSGSFVKADGTGCGPVSGTLTASPQFSLFYQPNSGTSAAAQGDSLITTDGAGSLKAKAIGGARYAAQYSTSNNGIASAVAANATVIADPSYGNTEQYKFTSPIPSLTGPVHVKDLRSGAQMDLFQDWGYVPTVSQFNGLAGASQINCINRTPFTPTGSNATYCNMVRFDSTTPGANIGNPAVPPGGGGNWQTVIAKTATVNVNGAGISQVDVVSQTKYGAGDNIGRYTYVNGSGGGTGRSDEYTKGYGNNVTENTSLGSGTASQTYTAGATSIKLNGTGCGAAAGSCAFGTGRYITDITAGGTATNITNLASGVSANLKAVTVAATVSASNAWATLNANVQPSMYTGPPFFTSMTFSVTLVGGTGFDTTHLVCFSDQFHDCAIPTAATNTSGATWSLTIPIRRPHASGAYIFQGGMAGYGLDNVIMESFGSGNTTQRYLIDVVGSTSTSVLQVTFFAAGASQNAPMAGGDWNADLYGTMTVTNISSNGTTVLVTFSGNSFSAAPALRNGANYIFSSASDGALNGTVCTNATFTNSTTFTCTMAGLSGTHTATTATGALASSSGTLYSAIKLWPMAEVIDVQNESLTPPVMDGTMTLEQNILSITSGDVLTEMNHYASGMASGTNGVTVYNPYGTANGISFTCGGFGCQGGGPSVGLDAMLRTTSSSSDSYYYDAGGALTPVNLWAAQGAFYEGIMTDHGPAAGASFINVNPTTAQKTNPIYSYPIFNGTNNSGTTTLTHYPNQGDLGISTPGTLGLSATEAILFSSPVQGMTSNDIISFAALAVPAAPTVVAVPGAGTLAAGTYCYFMTARNGTGNQTTASTETCAALASTGGMRVTWTRVPGATLYVVYGRTTGAEQSMQTVGYAVGTPLQFVDNGSITPSGTAPGTNLTLGFIFNSAGIKLNSAGTSNTANVTAPASVAGTYALGLPATGTAANLVDEATSSTVSGDVTTYSNTTGRVQDSGTLLSSLAPKTTVAIVNTCGTTTTCSNTAQASPRMVWGTVALTAGSAVITGMTTWTATTSFACTGTDRTAAAAVSIANTSTSSITITGTSTDTIAYQCVGN